MKAPEMLKPTQAAVVAGVGLRDVNDAVDRRILPESFATRGKDRRVSTAACMLLTFYHGSAKRLTFEERLFVIQQVSARLRGKSIETMWTSVDEDWVVRHEFLHIDLEPFVTSTCVRWKNYRDAEALVTSSPDVLSGTHVIRGTRIPVYDVAAFVVAGHSTERLMAAYPRLDAEQIQLAALYAKANPPQGRPRVRPLLKKEDLLSEDRRPRRRKSDEPLHR